MTACEPASGNPTPSRDHTESPNVSPLPDAVVGRRASDPAIRAVKLGDLPLVEAFCREHPLLGADLDWFDTPLLCYAVVHPPVLSRLLHAGCPPDVPDLYGNSALTWAICGDHLESVLVLLAHGARLHSRHLSYIEHFRLRDLLFLKDLLRTPPAPTPRAQRPPPHP